MTDVELTNYATFGRGDGRDWLDLTIELDGEEEER